MSDHWTHHDPAVRGLIAKAKAEALREAADALGHLYQSDSAHVTQVRGWLHKRADALTPTDSGPAYETGSVHHRNTPSPTTEKRAPLR